MGHLHLELMGSVVKPDSLVETFLISLLVQVDREQHPVLVHTVSIPVTLMTFSNNSSVLPPPPSVVVVVVLVTPFPVPSMMMTKT